MDETRRNGAPRHSDLLAMLRDLGRETEKLLDAARASRALGAVECADAETALHQALEIFRAAADEDTCPRCARCGLSAFEGDPRHHNAATCLQELRAALREAHAVIRAIMAPIRDLAPEESWETSIPTAHRADQVRHAYRFFERWGRSYQ